ncbi:glycosyltransferase family 39 protein [Candidatus Microgenomates bacterium]|nr:glycosyltransferase family 39 protein [Candidatus Microgenomates bacterium]
MNKYFLPISLSLVFLIVGIFTISDYGINWDAPIHMMRGQAFANFYLTGQKTYNLPTNYSPNIIKPGEIASRYYYIPVEDTKPIGPLPQRLLLKKEFDNVQKQRDGKLSYYQSEIWNGELWLRYDTPHLPLVDTLSAISNRLFWGKLGWFGDIESYQLVYILISSLGIFIVSLFTYEITHSFLASAVAGLSLGLFPIFFAESHINMKDPAQAVFFLGSIWAFWHWVRSRHLRWWGLFCLFVALALATKWNIVFLPLILIPWLILIKFKDWGKLGKLGILGGVGVIIFLIATWPAAWFNLGKLLEPFKYYFTIGTGINKLQPEGFTFFGFNFYPVIATLLQTPEIILLLGMLGVIWVIKERGGNLKIGYLLLVWLIMPALRVSLPGMNSYTGVRQIMEILPVMAILAGLGGSYLAKKVQNNITIIMIITIITVILLFPTIKLHPNQNAYFNVLLKTLPQDLQIKFNDWGLTYGNSYKQAVLWLNQNADENANIAHLQGSDYAISPLWLREDISISPYHFSGFDQKGEYILVLYNPLNTPTFAKRYPEKFLNPVHEIKAEGISLLSIYKNEQKFNKLDISKEKVLSNIIVQPKSEERGDFWEIRLDKDYRITRVLVENLSACDKTMIYSNELIFFIPSDQVDNDLDPARAFILNEKKDLGKGTVEYDFPAESASVIRIYPLNNQSCFGQGKIIKVYGIE